MLIRRTEGERKAYMEGYEAGKKKSEKTAKIKVCEDKVTMWYVCSECNRSVDGWDLYCRHCGAKLEEVSNDR